MPHYYSQNYSSIIPGPLGCSVALTQQCYTYRHDQVLRVLVSRLADMFVGYPSIQVYADLPGLRDQSQARVGFFHTLLGISPI